MSWSIRFLGKPENVAAAIEAYSAKLNGQSKVEYDEALPHLVALVKENFVAEGSGYVPPLLRIDASGSGTAAQGKQMHRSCQVKIETSYETLV